ncbi:PAS domain S-box protein, partial [Microcoleus sp. HI-ES]|nr:PAS domain S-box protein [Microcoleus sp. HI-ES]
MITEAPAQTDCSNKFQFEVKSKQLETIPQLTQIALENAADTIFFSTSDGQICYANQAACHLFGYSESELLNMRVSDIDSQLPASDWPEHWAQLKQQTNLTFETSYKTKDGASF